MEGRVSRVSGGGGSAGSVEGEGQQGQWREAGQRAGELTRNSWFSDTFVESSEKKKTMLPGCRTAIRFSW